MTVPRLGKYRIEQSKEELVKINEFLRVRSKDKAAADRRKIERLETLAKTHFDDAPPGDFKAALKPK